MHAAKPSHAPCLSSTFLTLKNGELLANPSEYRSMVGDYDQT